MVFVLVGNITGSSFQIKIPIGNSTRVCILIVCDGSHHHHYPIYGQCLHHVEISQWGLQCKIPHVLTKI